MGKNLLKILTVPFLVGAGLISCATYQPKVADVSEPRPVAPVIKEKLLEAPKQGIDLGIGYSAESKDVAYEITQLTLMQLGEIRAHLSQRGWDYEIVETSDTSLYGATPLDALSLAEGSICQNIDQNNDRFISESEVQDYLKKTHGMNWF